ncbi:MAG: hypothetical protein ACR2II_02120 [Chthoniobacterales bacterium]
MKTKSTSQAAFFNPRVSIGFALWSVGVLLAFLALSVHSSSTAVAAGAKFKFDSSGANLVSAASRLAQGEVGSFDIDMPLAGTSGVEDRIASDYTAIFTFDVPVTSGEVTVSSGTAVVGAITCSGNEMRAALSGVADIQIVVLHTQNINDDGMPHDDVPFGFLAADVGGDRTVSAPDKAFIRANEGTVTGANFRGDVNADGTVDLADGLLVRSKKRNFLP